MYVGVRYKDGNYLQPKRMDIPTLQAIGSNIFIMTCSSALFYICKSPIYRKTKKYWESKQDYDFIKEGGLIRIANLYCLNVDAEIITDVFLNKAGKK